MIFQEPKVEFVKMQLDDIICTSPSCPGNAGDQEVIGKCTGDQNDDDCTWPANYNY